MCVCVWGGGGGLGLGWNPKAQGFILIATGWIPEVGPGTLLSWGRAFWDFDPSRFSEGMMGLPLQSASWIDPVRCQAAGPLYVRQTNGYCVFSVVLRSCI